ncbi:lipopolysaccharide heptosyltransferase II [Acidihalobacter ferrooxydans]|uniref:lipopolysaccharide heptosyltransferase II n=1 Tax=Acidihalobacter ferrooxydans TaxID=1765967 RepID=A0A1P8UEC4_9GAMM|nr:lipopolysaccharide heptosyltransferase II [Acidihalobacter ferrooxydans]APZ42114.1 lipopolysaccharide heptosyltransferase II [Acidihalobacter ferrooxydans]
MRHGRPALSVAHTRCLIVGPSWVGDMIMAQSLFMALRERNPGLEIDVLAPAWTAPLLARMPEVHAALDLPIGHGELDLKARRRIARELRAHHYAQAIVLPNSLKSALIPWFARIPRRTGFRGEQRYGLLNDLRRLDKARLPRTVQRFVALAMPKNHLPALEDCPRPQLRTDPQAGRVARARLGLEDPRPALGLCPGAEFGPAKRWPSAHYAAVARYYRSRGWQIWVFGSQNDFEVAEAVCRDAGPDCTNLAGRTTLGEAIDLMAQTAAVVSNDSGLMHVAAALDRPLVAVYGSSDPGFTPPLSPTARIERLGLACSPCFQRECPLKHLDCLHGLHPDRIVRALDSLLDATA